MSLDRLINLAKKTGDRLIVHNPIDEHDVVIMDLDSYEGMLFGRRGIRPQTSAELLDEINRDIAKWRADQQVEEEWEQADQLEQEYWGNEDFAAGTDIPFGPNIHHEPSHWSSAGDVLSDRYGDSYGSFVDHDDMDWEDRYLDDEDLDLDADFDVDDMERDDSDEIPVEDIPFGFDDEDEDEETEELQYLEPTRDVASIAPQRSTGVHFSTSGTPTPVAFVEHEEEVEGEKPLKKDPEEGEGPVFLEEPV